MSRLIELEKEDRYVFHGSGLRLEQLEPRQAYTFVDGVSVPDDSPAIFASHCIDYAIFMALINRQTCPLGHSSRCLHEDGQLVFGASRQTLDQLNDSTKGFVHVFDRKDFKLRGESEWMCLEQIAPVEIIEIRFADFRPTIQDIPHGPHGDLDKS
jgi:hypothetical protein